MDLNYTLEQQAFRDQIRRFLSEQLQPQLADRVAQGQTLTKAEHEQWHACLHAHGYLAPNWRVPVDNLIGEQDKGWTYAKYLLTHERTNIAGLGFARAGLAALKRIAQSERAGGKALIDNPYFAARVAEIEIDLMAMAITNLRVVSRASAGQAPGVESSMLKVKGTVIRQAINDLMRRAVGPYAQPFASEALEGSGLSPDPMRASVASKQYFNNRKLSICVRINRQN